MTDAEASVPLAADPAVGTDSAGPDPAMAPVEPSSSRVFWTSLSHPFALGFFVVLGGLVAVALGLAVSNLSTILIYIAFALFAALGLNPVVRMLEGRGLSRAWSIVIVYAAFALVVAGVLFLIIPTVVSQISTFITSIPTLIANFEKTELYGWLNENMADQFGAILDEIEKFLSNPANLAAIGGGVLKIGVGIATAISGGIIVVVLSLYFLAGLPAIKVSMAQLAPARTRPKVLSMTEQIIESVGGYLMGMVILAFCNSMLALVLYFFLGLPFPALMAVVAFCVTLIPLVGSVLFWIIGSTLALFANPIAALIFAIVYLVYMQLEAYILTPRVMSKAVSVPGALVVIGAMVGGTLLGLLGALVAVPVTASILLIIKQVVIPRQDAKV